MFSDKSKLARPMRCDVLALLVVQVVVQVVVQAEPIRTGSHEDGSITSLIRVFILSCAGAQRGLYAAKSLAFERRLVA